MVRLLCLILGAILSFSINAKTLYSCILSQDVNMETGEVTNQISNNSLVDIYVEGNKLLLGYKKYSM